MQKAEESLLESNKSLHEELQVDVQLVTKHLLNDFSQSVNSSFGEKEQELEQLREVRVNSSLN